MYNTAFVWGRLEICGGLLTVTRLVGLRMLPEGGLPIRRSVTSCPTEGRRPSKMEESVSMLRLIRWWFL
jgi:hypothetical protein